MPAEIVAADLDAVGFGEVYQCVGLVKAIDLGGRVHGLPLHRIFGDQDAALRGEEGAVGGVRAQEPDIDGRAVEAAAGGGPGAQRVCLSV